MQLNVVLFRGIVINFISPAQQVQYQEQTSPEILPVTFTRLLMKRKFKKRLVC